MSARQDGMRRGEKPRLRQLLLLGVALLVMGQAGLVRGQVVKRPEVVEAPQVEINPNATRRFKAAQDLVLGERWKDAVEQIEQLLNTGGTGLVSLGDGRQVGVEPAARLLLSALPKEALERHRRRVDPLARRWWESGTEVDLRRIVERAFHSSFGDDALLRLGDLAWERGDVSEARSHWERLLLPYHSPPAGREIPPVAFYPDPEVSEAEIRARLILCSLALGEDDRARREIVAFRKRFPDDEGTLLGVKGSLVERLEAMQSEGLGELRGGIESWSTLGGDSNRSQVAGEVPVPTAIRWETDLPRIEVDFQESRPQRGLDERFLFGPPMRGRPNSSVTVLGTFPVIWQQGVFWCDDHSIQAFDLAGSGEGSALWGNSAVLFSLKPVPFPKSPRPPIGLPAQTLTISDDRLFARLGDSVAEAAGGRTPGAVPSTLVCLDLLREGELTWALTADKVGDEVGNWVFCSAPLVENGRAWVLVRKLLPQPVLNAVCLDATSGRVLWNRRIQQATALFGGDYNEQQSLMVSAADGRLFATTNQGAVVAIDARDGDILWVNNYAREESERVPDWHDRQTLGPNPCVCHDGMVFVAPVDSGSVFAFDGASGLLLWQRPVPGVARQVVGVSGGRLVVAANQLWGFDVDSGKIEWFVGNEGPESRTRGRCLLSQDKVLWPREEEILVVDGRAGRRLQEIPLAEMERAGGGNLAAADGFLVCAQADRLVVFWEYLQRQKKLEEDLARAGTKPSSLPVSLALALHETALVRGLAVREGVAEQRAIAGWRRVLEESSRLGRVNSAWRSVLSRSLIPLFLQAGQEALVAGDVSQALSLWQQVRSEASRGRDRGEAGVQVAELLMREGRWAESARVWNELARDPLLVRLPRAAGSTRSIGQSASIELARLSQLMKSDALAGGTKTEPAGAGHETSGRPGNTTGPAGLPCHSETAAAVRAQTGNDRALSLTSRLWTVPSAGVTAIHVLQRGSRGGRRGWVLVVGDQLECRELATGRRLWCAPLVERPDWVGGSSDILVLSMASQLVAMDSRSGVALWSQPQRALEGTGDFRRLQCDGNTLVRLDAVRGVESIDLRTGESVWRFVPGGGDDRLGWVSASGEDSPRRGLSPYWCVRDGIVAVQVSSPPMVCFLDLSDGFLRQGTVPMAEPWRADPVASSTAAWGIVKLPSAVELLDGFGGTVQRFSLPIGAVGSTEGAPVREPGPGRYWTDGRSVFWERASARWSLGTLISGREMWSCKPRFREGFDPGSIVADESRIYLRDGSDLCALETSSGKLAWSVPLNSGSGTSGDLVHRLGDWLVVAQQRRNGGQEFELRDPRDGSLAEQWHLRGSVRGYQILVERGEVVVVTDRELAAYRVPARP